MQNLKSNMKGVTTKILLALVAGAVFGLVLNYLAPVGSFRDDFLIDGVLYLFGQGFIKLLQMLVVPLVFCSLVCGSMSMGDTKTLGKMGLKTMLFYLVTTTLAIMIALCIANVINPGQNLNMQAIENINEVAAAESPSLVSTILNIIPSNIFQGLSEGVMLQIIFFALILGILLAQMGNERVGTIKSFFNQFNEVMMEMTMMMMRVAPIGVFCLISKTFSEIGFEALLPMLKYVLSVSVALLVQCFILYMLLLKIFTGLSPIQFLKNFFPDGLCFFYSKFKRDYSDVFGKFNGSNGRF